MFKVLVQLVAVLVRCESLSPGLRCTGTGSHIVAMSVPVPLIRQGYKMASAMPDPNENMFISISLWYLLRFFLVDQWLLFKKYIFWTYLQFFKEHNLKKRWHNLQKRA